jgi:hypothetical protein
MRQAELNDLQRELAELGQRRHVLKDHELFVVWLLLAAITDDEDAAVRALTGVTGEKSIDALLVDDSARAVFIVQGKYHKPLGKNNEPRANVMAFADLPAHLYADDDDFEIFAKDLEANALAKVEKARERLVERDYRLQCFYATTNRCAKKLAKEAESKMRRLRRPKQKPALEVFDADRVLWLLDNYLAGAAPPVPLLELAVQDPTLKEHDPETEIEAWVCSMQGDQVGRLFQAAGERIFARNIRGYLGETKVNARIRETLEREPARFWYFNNGITIVCDSAVEERGKGEHVLALTQPQIINGQQTTRTLAEAGRKARRARVPVRVISIPREAEGGQQTYDDLVAQIVEATNWQNAISSADLRANDRRQIEIQRELNRLGYFYIRKRQSKAEVRRSAPRHMPLISKEDLMRAGASCLRPNLPLQKGLQKLFEEEYDPIFNQRTTRRLLSQHMLFRQCFRAAWGSSTRKYGKFIACYLLWDEVSGLLRSNLRHEQFVALCRGEGEDAKKLGAAIEAAFEMVETYYRAERGTGQHRVEPSNFFKRRDVYKGFEIWLHAHGDRHARIYHRAVASLAQVITQ